MIDRLIQGIDAALRSVIPPEDRTGTRERPDKGLPDVCLTDAQRQQTSALMRVNHSGEVCAQALYQGQALTAKLTHVKQQMQKASEEEIDHLAWCEQRLKELDAKPSLLNPLWYLGSFMIGAAAGLLGDRLSLGFVAETEEQVAAHLQRHLAMLPIEDQKTRLILEQMHEDETEHGAMAKKAGALPMPNFVRQSMKIMSKLMTKTSYYI